MSGDLPAGPLGTLPSPAQRDPARPLPRPAGPTNLLAIVSLAAPNILLTFVLVFVVVR